MANVRETPELELDTMAPDNTCETDPMLQPVVKMDAVPIRVSEGPKVDINRSAFTQQSLIQSHDLKWEAEKSGEEKCKACCMSYFQCSGICCKKKLLSFFPFVDILREYKWKKWLLLDFISGLSIGVIHIPQGMGFALLTSLPAVYGLYSSFFPVLLYFFFGSSRHISMGTMALISLMIGAVVDEQVALRFDNFNGNMTENETLAREPEIIKAQVDIAVSVSLMVGCFQILMGMINLGIVATFMSMPFVSSFLTGAAVHIYSSQLPAIFGLKIKANGVFKIPVMIYKICTNITSTNVCALVTSLICLVILIILKEIINEKFKARLKVPIPAELFVVILGTIISHFVGLEQKYALKNVGNIPKGIPAPTMPSMTNATSYIGDSLIIAVISFAISISMSKLMAKKHKYAIDVNQELYAYGICHAVSSFFNCFAGAQAPPRTLVHDSIGGKTQVHSLFSCVLLLLVLLVLGPLFRSLPVCVLASVILVALLPLFRSFKDLPSLWKLHRYDFGVWMITFLTVVILDITLGLAIGIGISVLFIVIQGHLASGSALVNVTNSEIYIEKRKLMPSNQVSEIPGVKIFRFNSSLYFANVEKFKVQLFENTMNCQKLLMTKPSIEEEEPAKQMDIVNNDEKKSNSEKKEFTLDIEKYGSTEIVNLDKSNGIDKKSKCFKTNAASSTHTIILDCSAIQYIDIMGVNLLKALGADYREVNIDFVLANCTETLQRKLAAASVISTVPDEEESTSTIQVYPLIQDAVAIATNKRNPWAENDLNTKF